MLFQTAPLLANFLSTLTNRPTVVLAHSLGNMVTLSALSDHEAPMSKYFMLDAAVATETIDPAIGANTNMVRPDWQNYGNYSWASDWYELFATNDARSTLTWNGRLKNYGNTQLYNFYSSGEQVLRTYISTPPDALHFTRRFPTSAMDYGTKEGYLFGLGRRKTRAEWEPIGY